MATNYTIQEFIAEDIVIEGDDLVVDGNVLPIKQKLVFSGMIYNQDLSRRGGQNAFHPGILPGNAGGNSVGIRVWSELYHKKADGTYGERVKGGFINEYETVLTANSTTWVDATTGEILGEVGEELDPKNSQPALNDTAGNEYQTAGKFFGKTLIKEGQFYDKIASFKPEIIRDLIRQVIEGNKHRCQPKSRL